MSEASDLDWKTYESITRYIYESLGRQSGVKVKTMDREFIQKIIF